MAKSVPPKAIAFSNNDIAAIAWTFGKKIDGCLGFAIHRKDLNSGCERALPAWVGFSKDRNDEWKPKTTEQWPIQKFNWKDLTAERGGLYQYRIVPMVGTPESLVAANDRIVETNPVQLNPRRGIISAYFNRGILASQYVSHQLPAGRNGTPNVKVLRDRIDQPRDPLRAGLAGSMTEAIPQLLQRARDKGGTCYCALYELTDPELLEHLIGSPFVRIVLSNTGTDDAENEPARQSLHDSNVDITDRFVGSGHIGHNKFVVYVDAHDKPAAVLTGSTNWTANGLCAQTNNAILIESPSIAAAYLDYWERLKADCTNKGQGLQGSKFREQNDSVNSLTLEDGKTKVDLWFSPNTEQKKKPSKDPESPSDMTEVFRIISSARQGVLFLAFQPGSPSILDAIVEAQANDPELFVRGAITNKQAATDFPVELYHLTGKKPDAIVVPATAICDQFSVWEHELLSAGHAIIHDKIVVVDPFTDDCVVITGSHNLGYTASYANDENMLIIRGHRGLAEAYTTHVMDVYEHYRWRYLIQKQGAKKAFSHLKSNDSWQDKYFDDSNSKELNFWLNATKTASNGTLPLAKSPKAAKKKGSKKKVKK